MELWSHQRQLLDDTKHSRLWAAGMGTGKTFAALTFINEHQFKSVLILCPKSVIPMWEENVRRHTNLPVCVLTGPSKSRARQLVGEGIFITNYDAIWRTPFKQALIKRTFGLVVADESHRLKSATGAVSKTAAAIAKKANFRLALTGTPFHNSILDIYAQMRFINPQIIPESWTNFRNRYAVLRPVPSAPAGVYQVVGFQNTQELEARLKPHMTVIRTEDALDLPPLNFVDVPVSLADKERKLYETVKNELLIEYDGGTLALNNVLSKAIRLQQIAGGFVPDPNKPGELLALPNPKRDALEDLIEDIPEPLVVFCRFKAEIALVRSLVKDSSELSGTENTLKDWQQGRTRVLAVQIQSGAEGIDLTRASYGIVYSLFPSQGVFEQMVARLYRPGATKPVFFYVLSVRNTVDTAMYSALKTRGNINRAVLDSIRS